MSTKKAITYYKLESNYEGDITKYCGLAGSEIDANFYFLRGNDIADAEWDKEENILTLTKVNGETIKVEIPQKGCNCCAPTDSESTAKTSVCACAIDDIYYDKKTASLHFVFNGIDRVIEGFYSEKDVRTDYTIKGNGSVLNPLKISGVMSSGVLAPAISFIDMTESGDTTGDTSESAALPSTPDLGDRYVTYEFVSPYGHLFNFEAAKAINDILSKENSGWRVPTIEDWNCMLNAVELCDEDRTHRSTKSSPYLGRWAGGYLKDRSGSWDTESFGDQVTWKSYGFNVLPAGDYYEGHNTSYGKIADFWSSTMCDDEDVWVKKFHGNKNTVQQRAEEIDLFLSIRLVKDLVNGYDETEIIEGVPYNCVLMPSIDAKGFESNKVWTVENVSFSTLLKGDTRYPKAAAKKVYDLDGNEAPGEYKYFINEWNGTYWVKREMEENESVILKKGVDDSVDEEWIITESGLTKVSEVQYNRVKDYVNSAISEEADARKKADDALASAITNEAQSRKDADDALASAITDEAQAREDADNALSSAITEEAQSREDADDALASAITEEADARKKDVEELQKEIDEVEDAADAIASALTEEVDRARKIDDNIADLLGAEGDSTDGYKMDFYKAVYEQVKDADTIAKIESIATTNDVLDTHNASDVSGDATDKKPYAILHDDVNGVMLYFKKVSSNDHITGATDVLDALMKLDQAVSDETNRAKAKEYSLNSAITEETADRKKADEELQDNIDAEEQARKDNDIATVEEPLVIGVDKDAVLKNNNGDTVATITVDFNFGTF